MREGEGGEEKERGPVVTRYGRYESMSVSDTLKS